MNAPEAVPLSEQPVAEVAALALKESFAPVFRYFLLAAERSDEDVEYVHQLRIGTRRAEESLSLFAEFLPRKRRDRLQRRLSRLRKSAGAARDCDVFAMRLANLQQNDSALESLWVELRSLRSESQCELLGLFQRWQRGERLEAEASDLCCALGPRRTQRRRGQEPFGKFARRRLRQAVHDFFSGKDLVPSSPRRLHAFRIRTKRLRYTLELLRPGLDEEHFSQAYGLIKKLTQRLGDINDHATAERLLRKWRQTVPRGAAAGRLSTASVEERAALHACVAEFHDWWSPRRCRRLRRRLRTLGEKN